MSYRYIPTCTATHWPSVWNSKGLRKITRPNFAHVILQIINGKQRSVKGGNLFYGLLKAPYNPVSFIGLASIDDVTGEIRGRIVTRTDSQKMVATEAHFVGTPFFHGDYVYFLFREPALEVASLSNDPHTTDTYYSRIARICKNDNGTTVSFIEILTSYLKQRLVCCIMENNECSEELNEIQDFVYSENDAMIHAIFTNEQYDSPVSALCVFDLTKIDETFSTGSFFGSDGGTTNDPWREYDGLEVLPRPGFNDPVVSAPIKDLELLPDNNYLITTVSGAYNISDCSGY